MATLGRSYLDLYLIHWPGAQGRKREDPQNAALRKESWRALEQLYSKGGIPLGFVEDDTSCTLACA